LKLFVDVRRASGMWSPPMRGRGLKQGSADGDIAIVASPPMRGRGLKRFRINRGDRPEKVAPHAGAWIETTQTRQPLGTPWSPPMRGRGLKHFNSGKYIDKWRSPPMRGRGLKRQKFNVIVDQLLSPPMRGRGLKHFIHRRMQPFVIRRPPCGGVD